MTDTTISVKLLNVEPQYGRYAYPTFTFSVPYARWTFVTPNGASVDTWKALADAARSKTKYRTKWIKFGGWSINVDDDVHFEVREASNTFATTTFVASADDCLGAFERAAELTHEWICQRNVCAVEYALAHPFVVGVYSTPEAAIAKLLYDHIGNTTEITLILKVARCSKHDPGTIVSLMMDSTDCGAVHSAGCEYVRMINAGTI